MCMKQKEYVVTNQHNIIPTLTYWLLFLVSNQLFDFYKQAAVSSKIIFKAYILRPALHGFKQMTKLAVSL